MQHSVLVCVFTKSGLWMEDMASRCCRVTAHLLNKQSQTASKGWSHSLRVVQGVTIPHYKNNLVMKCYIGPWNWQALMNTVMNLQFP